MPKQPIEDKLAAEVSQAISEGLSYGMWKAKQNPVVVKTPKPADPRLRFNCQYCGKETFTRIFRGRKYCSDICKYNAAQIRRHERKNNG